MAELKIGQVGEHLAVRLLAVLRDQHFLPSTYPALFVRGVPEGSLHAHMLSALVLVGDRLGFTPVCDAPISDRLDMLLIGEGAKRPDAAWFSRPSGELQCLVEFERYSSRSLLPKAKNLLIMGKEIASVLQLAVLDYWTFVALTEDQLAETRAIFERGFQHPSGSFFPPLPCPVLVLETLVMEHQGKARILSTHPQLFIHDGEHKEYVAQRLSHSDMTNKIGRTALGMGG